MLDFLNDRYLNHINLNHVPLIRHNVSLLLLGPWFSHLEKIIVDSIIFDVSSSSKMRSFNCDKLFIWLSSAISLIDIKDWHFALCSFMFKGKKRGRMWREKEEKERLRIPNFSVISFSQPGKKKPFYDFLHVYTCPASCSLKLLFLFHNRINSFPMNYQLPICSTSSLQDQIS